MELNFVFRWRQFSASLFVVSSTHVAVLRFAQSSDLKTYIDCKKCCHFFYPTYISFKQWLVIKADTDTRNSVLRHVSVELILTRVTSAVLRHVSVELILTRVTALFFVTY